MSEIIMAFAADISRFVNKTGIRADEVLRSIALQGLRGVVQRTPVDTGRCRASWRVAINQADASVEPEIKKGKDQPAPVDASAVIGEGSGIIAAAKFGDSIYITNNLPYAPALEQGHSQQAPAGMLAVTFAELENAVSQMVGSVQSGGAPTP
jgi:hypothetical protein